MSDILFVDSISTIYKTPVGDVKAVDKCSFSLKKGETLGLAGESGCGKTTLAMSVLRLIQPPHQVISGSVFFKGQDIMQLEMKEFRKLRWGSFSLVLQQSMNALNPMFRIVDQMIEPLLIKKVERNVAIERAEHLLELVGIESSRINNYPHEFSGGMKQRVLIALALMCQPEIVVLDEPTTALDVVVQHNILKLIDDLKNKQGLSVIWITHDLAVLSELCDRIAIMYAGKIVETGTSYDIILNPKHPYTISLLSSFPTIDQLNKKLISIPGNPPNLINPPSGCVFHPRCQYAIDSCKEKIPELEEIPNRQDAVISCFRWREIENGI